MISRPFTESEKVVIAKVLCSDALQLLIGAEEWDLTESEEEILWELVRAAEEAAKNEE